MYYFNIEMKFYKNCYSNEKRRYLNIMGIQNSNDQQNANYQNRYRLKLTLQYARGQSLSSVFRLYSFTRALFLDMNIRAFSPELES